jgi:hypothetical protein
MIQEKVKELQEHLLIYFKDILKDGCFQYSENKENISFYRDEDKYIVFITERVSQNTAHGVEKTSFFNINEISIDDFMQNYGKAAIHLLVNNIKINILNYIFKNFKEDIRFSLKFLQLPLFYPYPSSNMVDLETGISIRVYYCQNHFSETSGIVIDVFVKLE